MPRTEIRPLTEDHLGEAARLLASRHVRHRVQEPLLDPRYERPDMAAAEVDALFSTLGASGAVAVQGRTTLGYVLAAPRPVAMWGPNIWVEGAGHALASEADPELLRDLYASAAQRWVDEGHTAHYALVPSHDRPLVDAWFRLGFGQQHVHGLREVPASAEPPVTSGVAIRLAEVRDIDALVALDLALYHHQLLAPVFSGLQPPPLEEVIAEWEESVNDQDFTTFVAERDGVVVGAAIGCSLTMSSAHRGVCAPSESGHLGFAAVRPEARGSGVGRALGEAFLAWTAEAGYQCAVTDWRATNLLSSRTWPRLGFRPSFLRLHRIIGWTTAPLG